jgi:hypothetical protein
MSIKDINNIHISEVVHFCFSNGIYVKKEQVDTYFNRLYVETPEKNIRGTELYRIGTKSDSAKMNEKIDELYRYFYKKLKEEQKK